jgi:hypothetical protein
MKYNNSLLYKWLIGNSFAFLILYVAWLQGWIALTFRSDASYLSVAMAVVFVIFWGISSLRIVQVNKEISDFIDNKPTGAAAEYFDNLRQKSRNQGGGHVDQSMLASALRGRMLMSVQMINYVANLMVLLGLIGTVVGFVIATAGLGESIVQGEGVDRIKSVLGQIVSGMGVALFTTIVGSILGGLWLGVHYQMLLRAVTGLVIGVVEKAEIEIIPRMHTNPKPPSGTSAPAAAG